MKQFHFKYGEGGVDLALPETGRLQVLTGHAEEPIRDVAAAVYAALDAPVGQAPLRSWLAPGDKVTLIVSDMSRFWMRQDLVIPHLVRYITGECGVQEKNLAILVANGTHIGGSEAELRTLVTDGVYEQIQVVNHDCLAPDLVNIGTTSRGTKVEVHPLAVGRKVVALGACAHHVMAGFGGGRKSILPGVASLHTIQQNHLLSLDPLAPRSNPAIGNAVLAGNPLHEDMCEAAAMVEQLYTVNLVMNADMRLARIYAGHWMDAWLAGCRAADEMYRVPIAEKADVIVASCGGYPKDMSLYQGTKTIDNVESGLKPGGTLVLVAECREGGGPAEYFDWCKPLREGRLDPALRENFTIPGYIFYLNCEQARRYNIIMLTGVDPALVAPMGIRAFRDPAALLAQLDLEGKLVYIIPNGSTVIPRVQEEGEKA